MVSPRPAARVKLTSSMAATSRVRSFHAFPPTLAMDARVFPVCLSRVNAAAGKLPHPCSAGAGSPGQGVHRAGATWPLDPRPLMPSSGGSANRGWRGWCLGPGRRNGPLHQPALPFTIHTMSSPGRAGSPPWRACRPARPGRTGSGRGWTGGPSSRSSWPRPACQRQRSPAPA